MLGIVLYALVALLSESSMELGGESRGCKAFVNDLYCPGNSKVDGLCETTCNTSPCYSKYFGEAFDKCVQSSYKELGCTFDPVCKNRDPKPDDSPFVGCKSFKAIPGCTNVTDSGCEKACELIAGSSDPGKASLAKCYPLIPEDFSNGEAVAHTIQQIFWNMGCTFDHLKRPCPYNRTTTTTLATTTKATTTVETTTTETTTTETTTAETTTTETTTVETTTAETTTVETTTAATTTEETTESSLPESTTAVPDVTTEDADPRKFTLYWSAAAGGVVVAIGAAGAAWWNSRQTREYAGAERDLFDDTSQAAIRPTLVDIRQS